MKLSQFASSLLKLSKEKQIITGIILFSGLLAIMAELRSSSSQPEAELRTAEASTFIPLGYVLVPIEVQNPEALDSILGSHGVVDLFSSPTELQSKPQRLAEKIKIIRAPLNPNHFAVLAPEDEAPNLVKHSGPFSVVIQNPKRVGTAFVKAKKKQSRVVVENFE